MLRKFILFVFLLSFSNILEAESKDMHFKILKNGMRVLLISDKNSDLVVHSVFYDVGGLNDFHGRAGLAHFLEHLMFRSTKNHESGDLIKFFDRNGSSYNAATGQELTFYYELGRKEILEDLMKFESDRMQNLILKDNEIKEELEVIKEERRMRVDNVPEEEFLERLSSIYYNNNYYGVSLIGSMSDLDSITNQDLRSFYRKYYNPQNAILVVVGNIDIPQTEAMVDKYYGGLTNLNDNIQDQSPNINPTPHTSNENFTFKYSNPKIQASGYYYMTSIPSLNSTNLKDIIPMEFLAYVMENGDNMLHKKLVEEKKLASNIDVQFNIFAKKQGQILIKITPIDDSKIDEIDAFMKDFLSKDPEISDKEVERLKNLLIADKIYSKDNLQNQAMFYGMHLLAGLDVESIESSDEIIKRTNTKQVKELFNKIFHQNSHIVGILSK